MIVLAKCIGLALSDYLVQLPNCPTKQILVTRGKSEENSPLSSVRIRCHAVEAESLPMQLGLKLQSFMVRNEGVLEIYGCKYVHKLKLIYKPVN